MLRKFLCDVTCNNTIYIFILFWFGVCAIAITFANTACGLHRLPVYPYYLSLNNTGCACVSERVRYLPLPRVPRRRTSFS